MSQPPPIKRPQTPKTDIRRVAILFSGGPAPAANAVISAAAISFLRAGIDVFGIRHGYSRLMNYNEESPLLSDIDYLVIRDDHLKRTRNSQGILIGTSRANPGKAIECPADLEDGEKSQSLRTVYQALCSLGVDALISIGGDDTLKTANKLKLFQEHLPEDSPRIPIVHLPKTIDNDYSGIDFTFGFFTAVEFLGTEIRNLLTDAESNRSYFLTETMGRSAGWLAYGAAIAGEASLVISVEDITGDFLIEEVVQDKETGEQKSRKVMEVDRVVDRIVKTILAREEEGKEYGVIVIAEGLAELLPHEYLKDIPRDEHGHISVAQVNLYRMLSSRVAEEYGKRTGRQRKITGLQIGYESRCAAPLAYDAILGSQLGVGAFRALVDEKKDGVMVSVKGQLTLDYVPFEELVDQETLVTRVRRIEPGSDFHQLARFLETHVND